MAKGKKEVADFIPAGTAEAMTGDPSDDYASPVDNNLTFTPDTTPQDQGLADPTASTGVSSPQ